MNPVPGKELMETLATGLAALLSRAAEHIYGPWVRQPAFGPVTWADLEVTLAFLLGVLGLNFAAVLWLRRQQQQPAGETVIRWRRRLLDALGRPLYLLIWVYGIYLTVTPLLFKLPPDPASQALRRLPDTWLGAGLFVVLFWLSFRLTHILELWLAAVARRAKSGLDDLFVPLVGRSLRVIIPVVGVIFALPVIGLPAPYAGLLGKAGSILIIGVVAWILFQLVGYAEKAVLKRYDISVADNLRARKVYTQVHVLGRTAQAVIAIFTAGSMLMLFEEVRHFGTSILASAGIIGIITGFAAQKTIANLFAGFQLAMTQPIRLDDVVIVEGEWGRIEEITLTYVVVRIWDERRMVLPLSYFIEKPFQNWTRTSADLMGSVFVWVDYSLPVDKLRGAVKKIVESSPLWDRRFWNLQVSDATERTMQLRVLATAADSSKAWDLRCEIREKLIAVIQNDFPRALPRIRSTNDHDSGAVASLAGGPPGAPS